MTSYYANWIKLVIWDPLLRRILYLYSQKMGQSFSESWSEELGSINLHMALYTKNTGFWSLLKGAKHQSRRNASLSCFHQSPTVQVSGLPCLVLPLRLASMIGFQLELLWPSNQNCQVPNVSNCRRWFCITSSLIAARQWTCPYQMLPKPRRQFFGKRYFMLWYRWYKPMILNVYVDTVWTNNMSPLYIYIIIPGG